MLTQFVMSFLSTGARTLPRKIRMCLTKNLMSFLSSGARTLPSNFYHRVKESIKSRFRLDMNLEVVDKKRISQVKVATIENIVGK